MQEPLKLFGWRIYLAVDSYETEPELAKQHNTTYGTKFDTCIIIPNLKKDEAGNTHDAKLLLSSRGTYHIEGNLQVWQKDRSTCIQLIEYAPNLPEHFAHIQMQFQKAWGAT